MENRDIMIVNCVCECEKDPQIFRGISGSLGHLGETWTIARKAWHVLSRTFLWVFCLFEDSIPLRVNCSLQHRRGHFRFWRACLASLVVFQTIGISYLFHLKSIAQSVVNSIVGHGTISVVASGETNRRRGASFLSRQWQCISFSKRSQCKVREKGIVSDF